MNDRFNFRTPIYGSDGKFKKFVYWPAVDGALAVTCREVDVFKTPEQCTGIRDKNGRLIYEGDIISPHLDYREDKVVAEIKFGNANDYLGFYPCWHGKYAEETKYNPGWRKDLYFWLKNGVEIIGNIHNNPELLEGQK